MQHSCNILELFKNNLSNLTKARGAKADIARRMGVSASFVQAYVDGTRAPGIELLARFAEALNTTPCELISGDGPARGDALDERDKVIVAVMKALEDAINRLKAIEPTRAKRIKQTVADLDKLSTAELLRQGFKYRSDKE